MSSVLQLIWHYIDDVEKVVTLLDHKVQATQQNSHMLRVLVRWRPHWVPFRHLSRTRIATDLHSARLYSSSLELTSQLQSITCHMRPHVWTCQAGWHSIHLPRGMEGWWPDYSL